MSTSTPTWPGLPPGPSLTKEKQTARMVMRPLDFLREAEAEFGSVFTLQVLDEPPWIVVSDPTLIAEVFEAPADILHAGEAKAVLKPALGENSLLLLDGERHMQQRRLLFHPFRNRLLERYDKEMRAAAEQAVADWPLGTEVRAIELTRKVALEVILRAVFGLSPGDRANPLREALDKMPIPGNSRESRTPRFRNTLGRIDELLYAEIATRREERGPQEDVLSLLLGARHQDGTPMSNVEIRDELLTLLMAGYETTATTLAWTLERLARHPDALARAEREAEEGGGPYLNAAIDETLRVRPALPLVARVVKAPFQLGEDTVRPGVVIVPAILLLHHRPDLYPQPDEFRPERFLGDRPDPGNWIPFGGGVRRCIGAHFALQEMRIVLAALLAGATVHPAEPAGEAMRRRDVTLSAARGVRVTLERR